MDNTISFPAVNVTAGSSVQQTQECVLKEHELTIYIDDDRLCSVVCTAVDLKELCYGVLYSRGLVGTADDVITFELSDGSDRAYVSIRKDHDVTCVMKENAEYRYEWIFALANAFKEQSNMHSRTMGTHTCLLAIKDKVIYSAEDISRHNAVDKVTGYMLLNGTDPAECILYTSGRVPLDMVRKVINARIPILVSKSVPTDRAIEEAKREGLILICSAWPDGFRIFNG